MARTKIMLDKYRWHLYGLLMIASVALMYLLTRSNRVQLKAVSTMLDMSISGREKVIDDLVEARRQEILEKGLDDEALQRELEEIDTIRSTISRGNSEKTIRELSDAFNSLNY
jgi:hypothetical protein